MYRTITTSNRISLFITSALRCLFYIRFFVTFLFLFSFIIIPVHSKIGITLLICGAFFVLISHGITIYYDIKDDVYGNNLYHRDKKVDILLRIILTPISKIHYDILMYVKTVKLCYFIWITKAYMDLIKEYTYECAKYLDKEDRIVYNSLSTQVINIINDLNSEITDPKSHEKLTRYKDIGNSIIEIEEGVSEILKSIYNKDPKKRDDFIDSVLKTN